MTTNNNKKLKKGDILFREGDRGGYAYFIESGEVEILKNMDTPEENQIQVVGKGQLVGEMSVLDDQPRSASARVTQESQVVELDKTSFLSRVTKDPSAAMQIIKTLSERLRSSNTHSHQHHEVVKNDNIEVSPLENSSLLHSSVTSDNFDKKTLMAAVLLCGTVFIAIIGSMLIEVKTTVSAVAKVVPVIPNLTIEAGFEGVLREVLVSDGDEVKKDQIIAYMNVEGIDAEIKSIESELNSASARLKRLKLESNIIKGSENIELNNIEDDVLISRLTHFNSKISGFNQNLVSAQKEYDISGKQSAMTGKDKVESGLISQMDYLDSQAALNEAKSKLEKIKSEKNDFVASWHADIEAQLEADLSVEQTLTAKLERLEVDRTLHTVRSPIAGKVLEVKARREGTVLSKGHPIVELTRAGEILVVEAEVEPKDAKALRIGLPVSFKLDALPFQRYGDIDGKIVRVDEDATKSRRAGVEDEFFMVRITLEKDVPRSAPKDYSMRRGSTGRADIITGDRTIFSYLLDPLMGAMRTAFREG